MRSSAPLIKILQTRLFTEQKFLQKQRSRGSQRPRARSLRPTTASFSKKSAAELLRANVISGEDARKMRWLQAFGQLIGNTGMHPGNLCSSSVGSRNSILLAPGYDMLPILYRPTSGELPRRDFAPQALAMGIADVWPGALQSALRFLGYGGCGEWGVGGIPADMPRQSLDLATP